MLTARKYPVENFTGRQVKLNQEQNRISSIEEIIFLRLPPFGGILATYGKSKGSCFKAVGFLDTMGVGGSLSSVLHAGVIYKGILEGDWGICFAILN